MAAVLSIISINSSVLILSWIGMVITEFSPLALSESPRPEKFEQDIAQFYQGSFLTLW